MKKIPITLLITLWSTLFTSAATAQNQPLACQGEAAAGLKWENGKWVTRTFNEKKFILVQTENTLTTDSVAKALNSPISQVTCRDTKPQIDCTDRTGGAFYFDPRTRTGGTAQLLGSTSKGDFKDTVTVQIFSCTPF